MEELLKFILNKRCFMGTTGFTSVIGATETPLMYIKNPTGSGVKLITTHFRVGINSTATGGVVNVYKNPTVTGNGSALTLVNSFVESTQTDSKVNMYKSPTITGNGQICFSGVIPQNSPSKGYDQAICLEEGASLLVTITPNVGGYPIHCDLNWIEAS